jgi:hypothetical protein
MTNFKTYLDISTLAEAVYPGNIGIMELIQFYQKAKPNDIVTVKQLIKDKKSTEAWSIIQKILGIKLF